MEGKWGEESRVEKVGEWGRGKQGGRGKVERSGIGWKIEDGEWRVERGSREWRELSESGKLKVERNLILIFHFLTQNPTNS